MKSTDIIKIENLNNKNKFIIRWQLTYFCNYYCDFCIQGNKNTHIEKSKGESVEKRTEICKNIIEFIETKLNNKYSTLNIYLIGGEVTILPDFLDIVKKLANSKFNGKIIIIITTNLSLEKSKLIELTKIFSTQFKFQRSLIVNTSFYKNFISEDDFIDKIMLLRKNKKNSKASAFDFFYQKFKDTLKKHEHIFNILEKGLNKRNKIKFSIGYPLCNDNDYREYLNFKNKYKFLSKNISCIPIKNYNDSISEKTKKEIATHSSIKNIKITLKNNKTYYCLNNNHISLILDEDFFNPVGYLCDIGINSISVNNLGIVSRCPSIKDLTIIGNFLENEISLPTDRFICQANKCNCSYYGTIEKVKISTN